MFNCNIADKVCGIHKLCLHYLTTTNKLYFRLALFPRLSVSVYRCIRQQIVNKSSISLFLHVARCSRQKYSWIIQMKFLTKSGGFHREKNRSGKTTRSYSKFRAVQAANQSPYAWKEVPRHLFLGHRWHAFCPDWHTTPGKRNKQNQICNVSNRKSTWLKIKRKQKGPLCIVYTYFFLQRQGFIWNEIYHTGRWHTETRRNLGRCYVFMGYTSSCTYKHLQV